MTSFLLDQQLSIAALVALFSVVTALRIIPRLFLRQEDDGSINVATRGTDEDTECEGCMMCLRSVRIVRAPPALPQPITAPSPRPSWFTLNIIHHIIQIFYVIIHFNPFTTPIYVSSTGDTQSDNHTRRGVYSESDGFTHHGLGDRNLNIVIDTSVRTSDVNGDGTQGGGGENTEGP